MDLRMIAADPGDPLAPASAGANISYVVDRVWTGGDLPSDLGEEVMLADLVEIQNAGITHIRDTRIECSGEEFVRIHAPHLGYLWNGADDVGQVMADDWFDAGVGFALSALADPDAQVLAHCHMGINRGPTMAFAVLLATGLDPITVLNAIRRARPMAVIHYADDALDWWHRRADTPVPVVRMRRAQMAAWHRRDPCMTLP